MQELMDVIKQRINDDEALPYMYNERILELVESFLEKEKEVAQQYAEFAIECDRKELPVLEFDGWINL